MSSDNLTWHIITGEYPPQVGGVSFYTFEVAAALDAQGDEVHVWCPGNSGAQPQSGHVTVHRELGSITSADLRRVSKQLDQFPAPRRILVQWVPHGYGRRSMNVPFCWWLRRRAMRHGDQVEIMLHEPFLRFGRNWRQSAAAAVHRFMTLLLLEGAQRVWMSIPAWEALWKPYARRRPVPFQWLPIPSGIPVIDDPARIQSVRRQYGDGRFLIGHFGTFGWPVTSILEPLLQELADDTPDQVVLLIGVKSDEFRSQLIAKQPRLASLLCATGQLSTEEISYHLAACDLLLQPYPDGVSARRSSVMAGISHGKPVVTNAGSLSEPLWSESGALAVAPLPDTQALLALLRQLRVNPVERARLAREAKRFYQEHFDISHTVSALRRSGLEERESIQLGDAATVHR